MQIIVQLSAPPGMKNSGGPGWRERNEPYLMNRFREKLQRFMIGRYGMDQLGRFLFGVLCVLVVLNLFIRFGPLGLLVNALELAVIILLYFRMFSRNVNRRWQENQAYLRMQFYVSEYFKKLRFRFSEGRKYRIFKCPSCGQKVRIPRGHGRVSIHCPKCGTDFIKRS